MASRLCYFAALFLAFTASMMVSYCVVRHLSQGLTRAPIPENIDLRDAELLRQFSNDLLRLTAEYLNHVPASMQRPSQSVRAWAAQDFRPRLDDLRRQMARSPVKRQELTALLVAADSVAGMAMRPEDAELRCKALDQVREAAYRVEAYIAEMRANLYLSQPALLPGF